MHKQIQILIKKLLERLAPTNMSKGELKKLSLAAGLGESTIRSAKLRQGLSADTLLALLLVRGVDPKDILNLPIKKPSPISPSYLKFSQLIHELSEQQRIHYMDLILWHKNRFKVK